MKKIHVFLAVTLVIITGIIFASCSFLTGPAAPRYCPYCNSTYITRTDEKMGPGTPDNVSGYGGYEGYVDYRCNSCGKKYRINQTDSYGTKAP